jgi:O-methyltransferase
MLFRKFLANAKPQLSGKPTPDVEYPLEVEEKLNRVHGRAPINEHLDILFKDEHIGSENFADLYRRCLEHTGTAVTPFNVFQRFQTRLTLVQYFLATLALPGARAECGAYRGATALLLCHARRSRQPDYRGADFFLIDSFSGTSANTAHDLIPVRDGDRAARMEAFFPPGKTDVTADMVRGYFGEYPEARICAGWIPEVFSALPECEWAFVHLDLTLYEPTLAALDYFYPRLVNGGVIVCDGSMFCPGAHKAWNAYCAQHDLPYVGLGHRENVIIKS